MRKNNIIIAIIIVVLLLLITKNYIKYNNKDTNGAIYKDLPKIQWRYD